MQELLQEQGFAFTPEPFSPLAYRLLAEPFPLGRSIAAFFGCIYIQDRSSMLPPLALDVQAGDCVLDMCASPGSKTGLLAQLTGINGLVLGNEPNPARLVTLRRNLHTLNLAQTATCCHPGERLPLPDATFADILLDPPCSGWGTTERNPKVMQLWKGDRIQPLIRLQRALLIEARRLLRPGGHLVYSTCTTNMDENEAQVRFARDELGLVPHPLAPLPGFIYADSALSDVQHVLRVDEDASEAQGFFVAAFSLPNDAPPPQEPEDAEDHSPELLMSMPGTAAMPLLNSKAAMPLVTGAAARWVPVPSGQLTAAGLDLHALPPGEFGDFGDAVHMLPQLALERLTPALRWQGMVLGRQTGGSFRPSTRLSTCLREDELENVLRVDMDEVAPLLALMQGQSLNLGIKGRMARLFWRGLPLGFLSLKSGRAMWSDR